MAGSHKLLPRFLGPFTITKRIGPTAYRLDLGNSALKDIHNVFHVSLLKPFIDNGLAAQPPPLTLEAGELEYEVSKIKNHRRLRGKTQYLVGFVGYDVSEDMWLDEQALENAQEILGDYKERYSVP